MSWSRLFEVLESHEFAEVCKDLQFDYLSDMIGKTDVDQVMDLKRRAEMISTLHNDIKVKVKSKFRVGDNND